ncbi:hypothetical protein [Auritidibacter ignavus]|nr:hypothetical protein [Auritidibacter ignavus]WHS27049.1 hypothetical protein QM395_06425 [Auritidibacter ignavus]
MIDLTRVDPRLHDDITLIVDELQASVGLDPDSVLVVGAGCRDILHAAFGRTFPLRATTDTDLGIAVHDWTISERIDVRFRRIGSNGIRYSIAGIPVDIMPFGEVEDPDGITHPAARRGSRGLRVPRRLRAFPRLTLPNRMSVRLPQPAGYAALKMRSWIDRAMYGHDKDAKDLALAAFWYQEAPEIQERLYDTDAGFDILTTLDLDIDLAATRLLGIDAAEQLSPANRADLARRWAQQDLDVLARDFTLPATSSRAADIACRRDLVAQFLLPRG